MEEDPTERRRRQVRESTQRHRARARGEDVPLLIAPKGQAKGYDKRRHDLQRKYGLTLDELAAMHKLQGGCCRVCGRAEAEVASSRHGLVVDHSYRTDGARFVRGLLCNRCNLGLGYFDDDPELLRCAAAYLDGFRQVDPLDAAVLVQEEPAGAVHGADEDRDGAGVLRP